LQPVRVRHRGPASNLPKLCHSYHNKIQRKRSTAP
jgi:hypothetical protein